MMSVSMKSTFVYRFAIVTFIAPTWLPIKAVAVSYMPSCTMYIYVIIWKMMTIAAWYCTPRTPARKVRIWKAQSSAQIMIMAGKPSLKYSFHSVNTLLSGQNNDSDMLERQCAY